MVARTVAAIASGTTVITTVTRHNEATMSGGPFAINVNVRMGRVSPPGGYTSALIPKSRRQNTYAA
ncbi:MAG TPA: hypothetical protein VKA97_13820, partial [Pyrinomonadaceae bacterium]|nr:hypothetical protein [Pyrinomonadaceae bacterium]